MTSRLIWGGRASKTRIDNEVIALAGRRHLAWRRSAIRLPAAAGGAWRPCACRFIVPVFEPRLRPPPLCGGYRLSCTEPQP